MSWPLPKFPEILLEICECVRIAVSGNFPGNLRVSDDGAGDVRSDCLSSPPRKRKLQIQHHGLSAATTLTASAVLATAMRASLKQLTTR